MLLKTSNLNKKIELNNKFILELRGFRNLIILMPGFAFDYRIFSFLDMPFNYLYPKSLVSIDTLYDLKLILKDINKNFDNIYLFGWSLGANLALLLYKDLPTMFKTLLLVSLRKSYKRDEILEQILRLKADPKNMLKEFYRRCFLGKKNFFIWFKQHIEHSYLSNFSKANLIRQLTYLESDKVNLFDIKTKIFLFYGKRDVIVPLSNIPKYPSKVKIFIFPYASHMPFLEADFTEVLLRNLNH